MVGIARGRAVPPISLSTGGCSSLGGGCVVNPSNGNLLLQTVPPPGDGFFVPPILSFNSTNSAVSSEIGNGWSNMFSRQVQVVGGANPTVVSGSGQRFPYTGNLPGGYQTPQAGTVNSLFMLSFFTGFTETQPDGTAFIYGSAASGGIGPLLSIKNPSGATWSLTYGLEQPGQLDHESFTRRTTLLYNSTGGKVSAIQDPFGRITTYSVNSGGNLVQVTSPELCISSLVYDGSNRPIAWINPLGDRTSYSFDSSNRVTQVQSPLGQLTTFAYNSNQTLVTNPLGFVTTLNFTSAGTLSSAIDGVGNRTSYSWDANSRLLGITDGLNNTTSFTYTTLGNLTASLASITQPLGGIFTYGFNSSGQLSARRSTGQYNDAALERRCNCAVRPSMHRGTGLHILTTAMVR